MAHYENVVILTGAGISAESGLDTFRDRGGIWEKYDLMELATPEAFAQNPARVHEFYNLRRETVRKARPNAAHYALARLEQEYPGKVHIITQNVDSLHERAGARNLCHMHGELNKARCQGCGAVSQWPGPLSQQSVCPACGAAGQLRPHIVWFGEAPFFMTEINHLLRKCDIFISIGTSGSVYPAAGFVQAAYEHGAKQTVELNLAPSDGKSLFSIRHYGKATRIVPEFVADMIRNAKP